MIRMLTVGALVLGLAACNSPSSAPSADVGNDATSNGAALNYQAAVEELPVNQRNVVLIRAIMDAGIECQGVTASERTKGDGLTYQATCADGHTHVISIASDGNAKVISASPSTR